MHGLTERDQSQPHVYVVFLQGHLCGGVRTREMMKDTTLEKKRCEFLEFSFVVCLKNFDIFTNEILDL